MVVAAVQATSVKKRAYTGFACPHCKAALPLALQQDGDNRCARCATHFRLRRFAPVAERGALPMPAVGDSAPCAFHLANSASASCSRCGAFICTLCVIPSDQQELCPGCFDRLAGEGVLPSARQVVRNWNGMAFHLSFLGLLFSVIGLLIGPAVIWLACKGLSHNHRSGERISHAAGWFSVVMGVILTGIGGMFLLIVLKVIG